jgi:DNA-binding XRE family transcriptional regulator
VTGSGRRTPARSRAAGPGSASCGPALADRRGGRCTGAWGDGLVVLAIGPEAHHGQRGSGRAVRLAGDRPEGGRGMARRLIRNDQVLAGMLQDPAFRAEWERTALARAVAEAVIRHRAERKLTQAGLARLLGWTQPVVARLEAAEHNPTMDTLAALSRTLGLRVHVDVGPKTGVVAKVTKSRAA